MVRYVKPVRWELGLPRPKGLLGAPRLVLYSPAVSCSDRLGILGLCKDCKDWMGIASLFGCGRGREGGVGAETCRNYWDFGSCEPGGVPPLSGLGLECVGLVAG